MKLFLTVSLALCSSLALAETPAANMPPNVQAQMQAAQAAQKAALTQNDQALKMSDSAMKNAQAQLDAANAQLTANKSNMTPEQRAQLEVTMKNAQAQLDQGKISNAAQLKINQMQIDAAKQAAGAVK